MDDPPTVAKIRVFRVRNLPGDVDRFASASRVAQALGDITTGDIVLSSLAFAVDPWSSSPTKTATVSFTKNPSLIASKPHATEWRLPSLGSQPLLVDTHFRGLTPLNDVHPSVHEHDCIAISGLASHPFGSWQPHGGDKSFMWIRDALPQRLPSTRFILYGYETVLQNSGSFQTIEDVANTLISQLKAGGWMATGAKQLLLLTHSLGGVVLKQTMVMLAGYGMDERSIIAKIKGAIFFGAPSVGMKVADILEMVGDQPNKVLVQQLSSDEKYLPCLEAQFTGIAYIQHMRLFWAYETKQTYSLKKSGGSWQRDGPGSDMVPRESATGGRFKSSPTSVIALDRDHSDMVKLDDQDALIPILVDKIREICSHSLGERNLAAAPVNDQGIGSSQRASKQAAAQMDTIVPLNNSQWLADAALKSLHVADLDLRLRQIDKNVASTFEWVFHDPRVGLRDWLLGANGLYWISGKPGSGKSTLMKYIWDHPWTQELGQQWGSGRKKVLASYFFHHRGVYLQKSFEGLLRSVITQIVKGDKRLEALLADTLKNKFPTIVAAWLKSDLFRIHGIQQDFWTRSLLEDLLLALLRQNVLDMDAFFLFDALDEYDGNTSFIADFLKRLTGTASPQTRVWTLFSSRPWPEFTDAFQGCPSFKIHDYTGDDILQYCADSIPDIPDAIVLSDLVEDICHRAQGVFLWVRLVVRELTQSLSDLADSGESGQTLRNELKDVLDAFPEELGAFYETIVQRIPTASRWHAYVLLETILRSQSALPAQAARQVMAVSDTKSSAAGTAILEKTLEWSEEDSRNHVKAISGGLVEVVATHNTFTTSNAYFVQFMHQTVQEFVQQPAFRTIILGSRARITVENGHSFISRCFTCHIDASNHMGPVRDNQYTALQRALATSELAHLRLSERTTGLSQYSSLIGAPCLTYFGMALPVGLGMTLYVKEAILRDPACLSEGAPNLATALVRGLCCNTLSAFDATEMAKLIAEHGWQPNRDPDGLWMLAKGRVNLEGPSWGYSFSHLRGWYDYRSSPHHRNLPEVGSEDYEKALIALLQACESVLFALLQGGTCDDLKAGTHLSTGDQLAPCGGGQGCLRSATMMLHSPQPQKIVDRLLSIGADPNLPDSEGYTSLDSMVLYTKMNGPLHLDRVYEHSARLVDYDARLRRTSVTEWKMFLQILKQGPTVEGNVNVFARHGYPKWISGHTPVGSARFRDRVKGILNRNRRTDT